MKNRKIYNILLAAVWILGGASCSLDEYNPGGSSLEALMTTQDGFKQAINNCYFGLQRSFYGKQIYIELAEAGTDFDHVIKTTCFLSDINDFVPFNEVYATAFTSDFPARSAVEVARLPKDVKIEIEVIAEID